MNAINKAIAARRKGTRVLGLELLSGAPHDRIVVELLAGDVAKWQNDYDQVIATGIYGPADGYDDPKEAKRAADADRPAYEKVRRYRASVASLLTTVMSGKKPAAMAPEPDPATCAAGGRLEDMALARTIAQHISNIGRVWVIGDEQATRITATLTAAKTDRLIVQLGGESADDAVDRRTREATARQQVLKICEECAPVSRSDVEDAIGSDAALAAKVGTAWRRLATAHDWDAASDWTMAVTETINDLGEDLRPADGVPPGGPAQADGAAAAN